MNIIAVSEVIMEEIKTVIEILERVKMFNEKMLDACSEEKLLNDMKYGELFQAFWQSNIRICNVIRLLTSIKDK